MDVLTSRIDKGIREFLAEAIPALGAIADELAPLGQVTEAFVLDGGKRLRPQFCYWGYLATGAADGEDIIRAAAALELLQACALVHDDVIDGSDTRRGAPAVHRRFAALHRSSGWYGDPERFGQAAAILLGDLALIWADSALAQSGFDPTALQRAAPVWDAMRVEVMCGQYLDVVEQARGGGSVERALRVARFKSAKYTIERPLHLGAALGAGNAELTAAFSSYGLPLGEAFQLRDDVLGVYGDPEVTGKPAGDDLREGKRTALVAYAVEAANPAQAEVLRARLGDPHLDADGVTVLRDVIAATGAVAQVESLIAERAAEAVRALDDVAMDDAARAALAALAETATARTR
ncbi:MAG TPA: polyprenyl synthetase family protein [Mycobacteriales bacterium]|nr:polyprenyl synthetase family protein [Mycobacteriales bacterium]